MLYFFITTNMLFGQVLFARTFGGTLGEVAQSITQTSDGGYAVTGYTYGFGAGSADFLVLKLNPDGSLAWARTFGGANGEWLHSMIQTADGGYAVIGETWSFGAGGADLLLLKLDPDGSIAWARTFGGTANDWVYQITQTADGGYAVAGGTDNFGAGGADALLLKLGPDGSLAWARTFGGTGHDYVCSVNQTADGGYVVAGGTNSFGAGSFDLLALKLNPDGSVVWARTFGGVSDDYAGSLIQTSDGGYAVAGRTASFGSGNYDLLVLKLNPDGSPAWARTFGGVNREYARSITQTTDGGSAVVGETESFSVGGGDFFILKLDPDGSLAWARTFGGTSTDYAESVTQTSDGGYVVAGYTWSFGTGEYDFLVLKIGPDGNYPDCVRDCSPTVHDVSLSTFTPSVGADCLPSTSSPSPAIGTPTLTITDACPSVSVEEDDFYRRPRITCTLLPSGLIFISPENNLKIRIYKPDGRLAYAGELKKGENRISLDRGVYFWMAGQSKGKAAVR